MRKILLFAGTTEGRICAEKLKKYGISMDVCVATEYGKEMIEPSKFINILRGRLDLNGIKDLIDKNDYQLVIDATHPYATCVSKNIKEAVESSGLPYIRIKRESLFLDYGIYFNNYDEMILRLKNTKGNILLTTGSKELIRFSSDPDLKERLIVRVIPGEESIRLCSDAGIEREKIIAMQGPFSSNMNQAIIKEYDIKILVTKESGTAGGFREKIEAAKKEGVSCFILRRPKDDLNEEGISLDDAIEKTFEFMGIKKNDISPGGIQKKSNISLIGIGMDGERTLTIEAKRYIEEADLIYGASRMIDSVAYLNPKALYKKMYISKDILDDIKKQLVFTNEVKNIAILYSGDTGFYSGASKMRDYILNDEFIKERIELKTLPGISSLSMMAARCNISYEDIEIISSHGISEDIWEKKLKNALAEDKNIFLITSGTGDVRRIIDIACHVSKEYLIYLGRNLSYEDEEITVINSKDFNIKDIDDTEGLYSIVIKRGPDDKINDKVTAEIIKEENSELITRIVKDKNIDDLTILGLRDEEFLRDEKTPMTKEEVREIIVSKLRLRDGDIFFDIGSGTGSIAIQASMLKNIEVYAVEEKTSSCLLIKKNIEKFGCRKISIFNDRASNVIDSFPMPDAVFIGGSGGELEEIIAKLNSKKNEDKRRKIRVVISTVTLETEMEIYDLIKKYEPEDLDIVEVNISKARKMGRYNLMKAENPIKIISFKL